MVRSLTQLNQLQQEQQQHIGVSEEEGGPGTYDLQFESNGEALFTQQQQGSMQ
jgi:hypothetical protein